MTQAHAVHDSNSMPITKYLQKQLDAKTWPQLLVLKDKHETEYYLCADRDALGRACLEILKARLSPQYGYIHEPDKEPYGLVDELTDEQIAVLPAHLQRQAQQDRGDNTRRRAEHAEELLQYAEAKKALADKDGLMAYQVLHDRRDHEYERVELIAPRVPK